MKHLSILLLLLCVVGSTQAQIDLGENNVRYSALKGGAFNSPKFSADGKYVAVLGRDYRISIFEVASGAYVCKSDSSTNCFAWSPDGMTIVITRSRQDNYDSLTGKKTMVYFLQFYNASNGKFEREIKVKNPIYDMLYSSSCWGTPRILR